MVRIFHNFPQQFYSYSFFILFVFLELHLLDLYACKDYITVGLGVMVFNTTFNNISAIL